MYEIDDVERLQKRRDKGGSKVRGRKEKDAAWENIVTSQNSETGVSGYSLGISTHRNRACTTGNDDTETLYSEKGLKYQVWVCPC